MSEENTDLLDDARVPMDIETAPLVRQFISIEQVTKDTIINPNNVMNELLGLSSIFARYGLLVAKARIQRDGFKSRRNLLAALLEKKIRDEAIEAEEKPTNPQVAAKVTGNRGMVEAELSLNEAAAVLAACTEARDAVKVKRDMLVQINKNLQAGQRLSSPVIPNIQAPPAADSQSTEQPVDAISSVEILPADSLFGTPIAAVTEVVEPPPDISDCV